MRKKIYFNIYLAQMYGIKKAVLINFLCTQLKDYPEAYVFASSDFLVKVFPFMSKTVVNRLLNELEHQDGLLISDHPVGLSKSYSFSAPIVVPEAMHTFYLDHAMTYGVEEAVILSNIIFWVRVNAKNKRNRINSKYWMYASAENLTKTFTYFNRIKIQRLLKNLEQKGAVLSDCFNKKNYDTTKWYTLSDSLKKHEHKLKRQVKEDKDTDNEMNRGDNEMNNPYQIYAEDNYNTPLARYAAHTSLEKCYYTNPYGIGVTSFLFRSKESKEEESIYTDKEEREYKESKEYKNKEYVYTDKKKSNNLFTINNTTLTDKYIKLWNKLGIRNHTVNTKNHKRVNTYIYKIITGIFTEEISKDWLVTNNIKNLFKGTISEEQIIMAMIQYSLKFEEGYAPEDKSKLNRNLADFIYNRVTKTSQLLLMLQKPVRKAGDINPRALRKNIPEDVAREVDKILSYRNIQSAHKKRIIYTQVNQTLKEMDAVIKRHLPVHKDNISFRTYIYNKKELIKHWLEYVNNRKNIDNYTFAVYGNVWKDFIAYLEDLYSIPLQLTEEEVKRQTRKKRSVTENIIASEDEDIMQVYSIT
jgi:hypothetical protein